jgi:hypothetical protein
MEFSNMPRTTDKKALRTTPPWRNERENQFLPNTSFREAAVGAAGSLHIFYFSFPTVVFARGIRDLKL